MIKVRAKFAAGKFGFYGDRRRYDGDEFMIEKKAFSPSWMEKLEERKKPGPKPKQQTTSETLGDEAE